MKSKLFAFILLSFGLKTALAQIPILNSNPSITNKVIYLDFDGQVVRGTAWNGGNAVNALPSTASANSIRTIFNRVSEDYRPFDVNITTDSTRFNNAAPNTRIRVIFTPTFSWYGNGAGGVAYLGSFTWGGYPGTPCWIFESQLGNNVKSMAEAASHEVGHTLSLKHQSTYNSSCVKTNEYNPGTGTGVTSWAPIMGVGYSKNITIFHNGKSADGCNLTQNDHSNSFQAGITGLPYLRFLPDDVGDDFQNAKILNLNSINLTDSGIVNSPNDKDAFKFTICANRYVGIAVKPWALDTNTYGGANMDVKLKLYNSAGTLLLGDSATSKLTGLVGMNLTPGSYFFTVDGDASAYYSDYGVLGKYYVRIKTNNPPAVTNTINLGNNICAPQTVNLNYNSNANPSIWQWTVSGSSTSTYNTQNPAYNFATAGIYTVSLIANTSSSLSCLTTQTIEIGSAPNLSASASSASICSPSSGTISVTGANSYTWVPGNFTGNFQIVNANSNTSFTIIGSNGSCSTSITKSIGVSPNFILSISTSTTLICPGKSLTITPTGGINYTLLPSGSNNPPFVVSPNFNTTYTVLADNFACKKSATRAIQVNPTFTIGVDWSDSVVCANTPITLFAYGVNSFTTFPGGQVGNQIVVTPSVNTTFTVTGEDFNQCTMDSLFFVRVDECDYLSINEHKFFNEIQVFPNPGNGPLTIQNINEETTCMIFDANGKLIDSFKLEASKTAHLNTNNWAKGIYLFSFQSLNQKISNLKVLVE